MSTALSIPYIGLDERGCPIVEGTTIKVRQLIANKLGSGATPDQLAEDANLSLPQVHAALLYYYEHQQEIDNELAQSKSTAASLAAKAAVPEAVHRWNALNRARG